MNYKLRSLVAATITGSLMLGLAQHASADSTTDIVNALVTKGVLTEEEGALLTKGRAGEVESQEKKEKKISSGKVGGAVNIRGYLQVRNTTMLGGDEGINLFSDRSVGDDRSNGDQDKNFLIRRARVILFGDIGERLYYYIQPDFASTPAGAGQVSGNFAQLRDAYGDLKLTKDNVHRIRVGQSKVPYGFENLQSSQNRLALDRADALNSALKDERDLGAFYYYTPLATQELFKEIGKLGLKHSGDYGQFGFGFYNGQGANNRDRNDNYHTVARYTHPWKTESGQIYEAGIQAYRGEYVPVSTGAYRRRNPTSGALETVTPTNATNFTNGSNNGIKDERVGISFMMYPQPFGLQAEWNWGKTPGLDIQANQIQEKSLNGGYIQAMYKIDNFKFLDTNGTLIPFIKWQYFDGYNKAESNAAQNHVNDWEVGAEWQIAPEVELVAYYHRMKRTNLVTNSSGAANPEFPNRTDYETFNADALRVQLQYNF
ncbi:porin [Methylotenera sp. L2L1]|uniref:porin n=1 Tax=Methylotenera sp. L2L1 TaxID=1502770 RepID=UPI00055BBD6D|nr:porin [Methylotenera sp. L2L1]